MRHEDKLPEQLQDALNKGLLRRLPITFRPFTQQQLRDWNYLFPYERESISRTLLYLASLSEGQFADVFREVTQLEEKMGVRGWQFSTDEQTILNASLIARSAYYQEWRRAVQKVFDVADQHAPKSNDVNRRRLIFLNIPQPLPLDRSTVWQKWLGVGQPLKLDLVPSGGAQSAVETLVAELLETAARRASHSAADAWILDAGSTLVDGVLKQRSSAAATVPAVLLGNSRLADFRDNFSREMNTIRKDLADADAVSGRLRKTDVTRWCPAEVASEPVIREFVRSLYLSGNGALIFGNSFVEWGAAEAFRRARPAFLAGQFGIRSKPKPFTSVAVFENPDRVNPLPAVDDLPGSALDAQMLAHYVWLAAGRYEEYHHNTICLCLAESLSEAYTIAPQELPLWNETQPITLDRLRAALASWLT